MKKTVLTFGVISGAVMSAMMLLVLPFQDVVGFDKGEIVGYTAMVLAFLLTFFGIRSYRDTVGAGAVSFGRALAVGLLITAVASACYVLTWELIYFKLAPDFGQKYQAYMVESARARGDSEAAIEKRRAEMAQFMEWYKNPAINAAVTFLEPLPVGVVIAALSAAVLRRKPAAGIPAGRS